MALRMNPAVYASLPTDACAQGTAGPYGQDRITRNTYDAADRLTQVEMGVGTAVAQVNRTQAWTANGKVDWVQDANQNRSNYVYDGFDRLAKLEFPLPTPGSQAPNPADYEQYGYDAADNLVTRRLRDGQQIGFTYDALDRQTVKTVPGLGTANDVFTRYDLLDRRLAATFVSPTYDDGGVYWTWDALGRPVRERAVHVNMDSTFDLAGRRTALRLHGTLGVDFQWDLADRMTLASQAGQTPVGAYLFGSWQYDALGRRTVMARGNGATTSWAYDPNGRDWSMTHQLAGTAHDVTYAFAFNPAGQAVSRDTSNPLYQYPMTTAPAVAYQPDGLNQYDAVDGTAFVHDARGNLTSDGVRTYAYDPENRLTSITEGAAVTTLTYDPLGRLKRIDRTGTAGTLLLWDGDRLLAEYDGGTGQLAQLYAHGPGPDEPLAEFRKPVRTWFLADHQGSIVAETDATGALIGSPYTYDPYGRPDAAHGFAGPRFRYTGQTMIVPQAPLWHYKARAYDPGIGRFLQTDPIGYEDSLNLYQYVGNDPFNGRDPTGEQACPDPCRNPIISDPERDAGLLRAAGAWLVREIREDPVGVGLDAVAIVADVLTGPSGEAVAAVTARRGAREAGEQAGRRWGSRGRPDHRADVQGPGRAQAEAQAQPGEQVLTERRVQGHPGVNRCPDNQIVGCDGRTRLVVESERRPTSRRHRDREAEYQCVGIACQTRPLDP